MGRPRRAKKHFMKISKESNRKICLFERVVQAGGTICRESEVGTYLV